MPIPRRDFESVDLPIEEFRQKSPVWIEFAPDAWPGQRIDARFTWNPATQRYSFSLRLIGYDNGNDGVILPWTPVQLNYPYFPHDLAEHFRVIFHDPSDTAERVTAGNIGDPVEMTVWPGPSNPAYEPYQVDPADPYDPESPPEPWMPPLGIRGVDVY